jgi:nucleoside-diphosphate-sugar epimerase
MKLDDGRIFADFARDVLNGDILHINSNGKSVRAYCYISDAVEAFFKTLLSDFNGHAFNIGNENQCYSVNQLAQNVQLLYPKMKIQRQAFTPENNISAQDSIITPDTSKAKEFLNWFPKVDFTSGFKRTIESYQVAIIP